MACVKYVPRSPFHSIASHMSESTTKTTRIHEIYLAVQTDFVTQKEAKKMERLVEGVIVIIIVMVPEVLVREQAEAKLTKGPGCTGHISEARTCHSNA